MTTPKVEKVTVHMSVGESGKKLSNAEMIMQKITGQKPVRNLAKRTLPAFGTKKGEAIGCKVTLRGDKCGKVPEPRSEHPGQEAQPEVIR